MAGQKLSLAREIAYDAFTDVMHGKRRPEDALQELYEKHSGNLKRLDRNFIKEIVYGGLRWYSKIFWILQKTSSRNLRESPPAMQTALVLGTYQIFYMDRVPDRAAVNESVEYVRTKGHAHATSFANGILRQIARRAEYFAKPDKVTQQADYLSLQFAHPKWIVDRWLRHFKFERMETMLAANNQPPPFSVRINSMKTQIKDVLTLQSSLLKNERTHSERRPLRSCLRLRESPDTSPESIFGQGFYTVQDEASQLIAGLVGPTPGSTIVDACAGPGGKLTHLYEMVGGEGTIFAVEKDARQMQRAQETARRLQHDKITWIDEDFLNWLGPKDTSAATKEPAAAWEGCDHLLLDAPCSALGVLRRHPEGKWHKDSTIINAMAESQRKFLQHALTLLKPGGELVYSVCSFEPEETLDHLRWLDHKFGDKLELISPVSRIPDYYKKYVTRENVLLIYSGNPDEMDGFGAFIVRVKERISP